MGANHLCRLNQRTNIRIGSRVIALLLSVLSLATLSSFDQQPSLTAFAVNLNIHGSQKSEDDDDDLNVDPNMAQGENQYMFGAAVSQVESNQADKEDKGEEASEEKKEENKKK